MHGRRRLKWRRVAPVLASCVMTLSVLSCGTSGLTGLSEPPTSFPSEPFLVDFEEVGCRFESLQPGNAAVMEVMVHNRSSREVFVDFDWELRSSTGPVKTGNSRAVNYSRGESRLTNLVAGWFSRSEVNQLETNGFSCHVVRVSENLNN